MAVDAREPSRNYKVPAAGNLINEEFPRVGDAIRAIGTDMAATIANVALKAPLSHTHTIANVTGLQAALDAKSPTSHTHSLDNLSDVDVPSPSNGQVLRFVSGAWGAYTITYSDISGLGSAAAADANLFTPRTGPVGAIKISSGTTAERPTPGTGERLLRYNTTTSTFETWDGTAWASLSGTGLALTANVLAKASNLNDVADKPTALLNLGVTAFAQTLLDDTNQPTMRATLGLGTAATLNVGTIANAVVQLDNTGKLPAVDGSQLTGINSVPAGAIAPYAGRAAPLGWLLCDGSNVSRSIYAGLFAVLCPVLGNFTVTIASPAVVTLTGHGLRTGDRVRLSTTGALPTGLATVTDYFVNRIDANTFNLRATPGGANINTSGTQSGTHSMQAFAFGAGDGSTTFGVPDLRGRVPVGADAMGGTAAALLTVAGSGIYGEGLGQSGGAETVALTVAQMAAHTHTTPGYSGSGGQSGLLWATAQSATPAGNATSSSQGSGTAHQNTQPSIVTNFIIKA